MGLKKCADLTSFMVGIIPVLPSYPLAQPFFLVRKPRLMHS
jgi:hypothetical protein